MLLVYSVIAWAHSLLNIASVLCYVHTQDEVSSLRDALHTASRELHKVVKLVDNSIAPEVKDVKQSAGERFSPNKDVPAPTAGMFFLLLY